MSLKRDQFINWRMPTALGLIVISCVGLNGCPQTGACCDDDGTCNVVTEAACTAAGGTYQGDGVSCDPNPCPVLGACCEANGECSLAGEAVCEVVVGGTYQGDGTTCDPNPCEQSVTIFSYDGGDCPPELTVKDGDAGNVECGVPRSRLFDDDSPLDGSMADDPEGDFGTFPGDADPDETGILVRLDGFAVDPGDGRANIVIICLNIVIPPQAEGKRTVETWMDVDAGFELTPEAQAVVDSGKRNYWARQARKLAKLRADAAGGVDPRAADRADRLERSFQRKNNDDYEVLADGTRYMPATKRHSKKVEIIPAVPGQILTIYIVYVGDAFSSLGEFMTSLEVMMGDTPDADSPMLGDIDDNALVLENVDELGPATVVDYSGGVFDPNLVDLVGDPNSNNLEDAIWITNSGDSDLILNVFGHPQLVLPADQEVAFNDLFDGGTITGQDGAGNTSSIDIFTGEQPLACCIEGQCSDEFTSINGCFDAGGSVFVNTMCADNPCGEPPTMLACCIEGVCDEAFPTEDDCFNQGGQPFVGQTCKDVVCQPTTGNGACCYENGCIVMDELGCQEVNGTYQGDETTCESDPCP